jgi:ribonuclease HI
LDFRERLVRGDLHLQGAMETESLAEFDQHLARAFESLCDEHGNPQPRLEAIAPRIKEVIASYRQSLLRDFERCELRKSKAFGRDFGQSPDNFYLTMDQRIVWAKEKVVRNGEEWYMAIPYDCVTLGIDELVETLQHQLDLSPEKKEILDHRADAGAQGDVGAIIAGMTADEIERFVPMCKLALESQRLARSKQLNSLRTLLSPVETDLRAQVHVLTRVRRLEHSKSKRNHIVYVDAGYRVAKGGFIAWMNEATGQTFYALSNCEDSFRCEYVVILHFLEHAKGIRPNDEIEIRSDNDTVVNQLNHEDAINDDDIREFALRIWSLSGKLGSSIRFVWIPRARNKAGKMLGS